jgi:serine/threonine protein kinase
VGTIRHMPLASGQTFAGYRIIRLLGSGGMGEVYLAQHPRLPRCDALKILGTDVSADEDYRQRFIREADLAATLWHPNIVRVNDRGEFNGQLWISMDYVDGTDAAKLVRDRYSTGMPADKAVKIVTAIASALDYAHQHGLLHRDVKPANILLASSEDGERRILLTDFGIARKINDISGLTKTNMTVGTVAYCAPEQLLGEDVDGRADQYSLAATAYHLLTGSHLFPNSNPAVVISRHLNVAPPALADSRPELAVLDSVLAVGLAKRPEDRFTRCSDFAHALNEQTNPVGGPTQAAPTSPAPVTSAAPKVDSVPSQGESVDRKAGKSRVIAAAAAVVAAILVAGLIVTWRPWERQAPPTSRESSGPATSMEQVLPQVTTTTAVQPPPQPLFSPKAIDQVLLTADQLSNSLGVNVTTNAAGGGGGSALAIKSSSYGMLDHSGQVKPPSCVGVAFTGEHDVYATSDPAAIKVQTFGEQYGGSGSTDYIEETAAVFSSTEQAQKILKSSQDQWDTCSGSEVDVTLGYENGRGFKLGEVQRDGDLITISMASASGLTGLHACQQAFGIRANVVVEARTCEEPTVPNFTWQDPVVKPAWASPTAAPLANAMLKKVTI